MTAEEFITVHNDTELRDYILRRAQFKMHRPEDREDLIQEAWLWISAAPGDYTTEKYKQIARRAMHIVCRAEWKQWALLSPRSVTERELKRAGCFSFTRL